jgi:hypothetical protein
LAVMILTELGVDLGRLRDELARSLEARTVS